MHALVATAAPGQSKRIGAVFACKAHLDYHRSVRNGEGTEDAMVDKDQRKEQAEKHNALMKGAFASETAATVAGQYK